MKHLPGFILLLSTIAITTLTAAEMPPGRFEHFITRRGDKLYDGEKEFLFIGANMPGLVLPCDFTARLPERMILPNDWEQEDGFQTLAQMGLGVVRWWNLPIARPGDPETRRWAYVLGPGQFNEDAFVTIDRALALANRYGIRVIFPLNAEDGDFLGGIGDYAAYRGKKRPEFYTDPQLHTDFQETIRYVVNRRNTITGVPYRDDKAILCWEMGNEMRRAPAEWEEKMAAYLKSMDPNHLVIYANDTHVPEQAQEHLDIFNRHYYKRHGEWVQAITADYNKSKDNRPLIIGEFGLEEDVSKVQRFLDAVVESGASGALIWSLYFHHREGGFWHHQIFTHPSLGAYHWPGFAAADAHRERQILRLLRDAAFRIQARKAPALPVPDPPSLLPIGDVPLLSCRGSPGANGYDVERAAKSDGPWTAVADNVSDADTAYRPLFSDNSVRTGDVWYYRVRARNESGASQPSNVVGPVRVAAACLADELRDFTLASGHSDQLQLVNDHNARYSEYPFRAKGNKGQWITWRTQGAVTTYTVFVWSEDNTISLQVSSDGKEYHDLAPEAPATFGKNGRKLSGKVPAGQTHFRVRWTGPAKLDRVEIYHQ